MNRMRFFALAAVPVLLVAAMPPASPVADAAMRGDLTAIRALIAAGRDVNAAQGDGMTALHWAADHGDLPMVEALLKAKASVKATTHVAGYTPLHLAAKGGFGAVVAALLKAGADPNQMTESGAAPIHLAAASGSVEGVTALLDKGADPNMREKVYGQTPLIFAAEADRAEVITLLVKRGADVNAKTRKINLSEETAAEQAAARKRNEVLISFEPEKHKDDPKPAGADVPVGAMAKGFSMQSLGFASLISDGAAGGGGGGGGGGGW